MIGTILRWLVFVAAVVAVIRVTRDELALSLLLGSVFLLGVIFLLFGFPGRRRAADAEPSSWIGDPGTRTGSRILGILLVATGIVAASQYKERSTVRVATIPFQVASGFRDCDKLYCPTMVTIPAGAFDMGSDDAETQFAVSLGEKMADVQDEKPRHRVTVEHFALSVTEVTRDQFEAFVTESRYKPEGFCFGLGLDEQRKLEYGGHRTWEHPGFPQTANHPVVCVTWHDAKAYAAYLSRKTGHKYRLPSEAEWEYAARAGSATSRYWGQDNADACQYANVSDSTAATAMKWWTPAENFLCTDGFIFTAPAGKFKPNAFGLHDMMGNVWEWTEDCYNTSYNGAPANGSVWLAGNCNLRVIRGGSGIIHLVSVRSAGRNRDPAAGRSNDTGFRVARTD